MYIEKEGKKINVVCLDKLLEKTIGLMFKKDLIKDIYLFSRCSMIHTFFMKQNIDVLILDKNYVVLSKFHNVFKNKIIIKSGYYTLEMPVGYSNLFDVGEKVLFFE